MKITSTRRKSMSVSNSLPLLALALVAVYAPTVPTASAQEAQPLVAPARSAGGIDDLRARTRMQVESVSADTPGELDNARNLGAVLPSSLRDAQASLEARRAMEGSFPRPVRTGPGKGRHLETFSDKAQWPSLRTQPEKVTVPRPAIGPQDDDDAITFTPDFSRQKLTFAGLLGEAAVNLPEPDINDAVEGKPTGLAAAPNAPSLPDFVRLGLEYSPVLDQLEAQLKAASFRAKEARSDLLPQISARYSKGTEWSDKELAQGEVFSAGDRKHTQSSSSIRITQPIFNIPALAGWLSELSVQNAAKWRSNAARETVALAVTQATVNLSAARLMLDFSAKQLTEFEGLLDYLETRQAAGMASSADLERTRTRVLLARQTRVDQITAYRNAVLELERLTGQKPDSIKLPFLNQLPGLPTSREDLRRLVWKGSFELRALRAEVVAQKRAVWGERSRFLPQAGLSLERDESRNVRGVNARQTDERVMGVVSWNLSMGGKEFYATKAASAELASREARLAEQEQRVMQSVEADFAALQSATLRVEVGQAELKAASAVASAVGEQLRLGKLGSLLEALDAYERHYIARQRLVQTLSQQMQAQAQLLSRIGALSGVEGTSPFTMEGSVPVIFKEGGEEQLAAPVDMGPPAPMEAVVPVEQAVANEPVAPSEPAVMEVPVVLESPSVPTAEPVELVSEVSEPAVAAEAVIVGAVAADEVSEAVEVMIAKAAVATAEPVAQPIEIVPEASSEPLGAPAETASEIPSATEGAAEAADAGATETQGA